MRGPCSTAMSAAACCVLCLLCHPGSRCAALQQQQQAEGSSLQQLGEPHAAASRAPNAQVLTFLLRHYGDGREISPHGFDQLLQDLKLLPSTLGDTQKLVSVSNDSHPKWENQTQRNVCQRITEVRQLQRPISVDMVLDVCPALLVQIAHPSPCLSDPLENSDHHHHDQKGDSSQKNQKTVWMYATGSIVIISACGLLAVAVIPIMQRMFYQQLLQFLVSLAVGSLCGDALLHLLPHAMSGSHLESHLHGEDHAADNVSLWRGFVALIGIVFFFFMEKCLTLIGEWRRRSQRKKKVITKVRVMRDAELQGSSTVGEKLCKHKYSSYPYCYDEIKGGGAEDGEKRVPEPAAEPPSEPAAASPALPQPANTANPALPGPEARPAEDGAPAGKDSYTVILREHERAHHGHSHSHGHVHSAPHSLSAVAWMVVMGDGLHNLTDGLAIGAAFAASIPGGLSTALAVFCHELPHELGDFAVLLKAGMSAKQAVCYNLLSSFLCFIGMVLGVCLGHAESTAQWVFAAAAGMFLYIALVDMIPELTSGHSEEAAGSSWWQTLLLQLTGMLTGLTIMLLIALYEKDLHTVFCEEGSKECHGH